MFTPTGLICLSFFVLLINPLGWHMIIHALPLYLFFIFQYFGRLNGFMPKPIKWFLCFFIYTLFSSLFISHGNGTFSKLIRYFYELLIFWIFLNSKLSFSKTVSLIKFYILSCIGIVIKMIVQHVSLPEDPGRYSIMNFGKIMDPNFLAALFILPTIILFHRLLHKKKQGKVYILFILFLLAILATGSRGGLISVGIGCLILFLKDSSLKKKITFIFLSSIVLMVLVTFEAEKLARYSIENLNDGSNALRFHLWGVAWDIFMSNPILGRGANSMLNLGMDYGARINIMVHNTYLEILADYGILGFILWIAPFILILKESIKQKCVLVTSILISTYFCAFFISAQDSAFLWQNVILSYIMLSYNVKEISMFKFSVFKIKSND